MFLTGDPTRVILQKDAFGFQTPLRSSVLSLLRGRMTALTHCQNTALPSNIFGSSVFAARVSTRQALFARVELQLVDSMGTLVDVNLLCAFIDRLLVPLYHPHFLITGFAPDGSRQPTVPRHDSALASPTNVRRQKHPHIDQGLIKSCAARNKPLSTTARSPTILPSFEQSGCFIGHSPPFCHACSTLYAQTDLANETSVACRSS